jgi:phage/plasmid-like protein (TIGR03299 family)
MSRETYDWLNTMCLVGDTDRRGKAWHYRESDQGAESNHYTGAIPVADVRRRLFGWEPVAVRPMVAEYVEMTEAGVETVRITDENRQMIVRPRRSLSPEDPGAILGTFKAGYKVHGYDEWLVRNVEAILEDELHVSAAGLLREGAQAWVEVSIPETITTPEGVEFRPNLLACTSLDGSIATGYARTVQLVVCDNTLSVARSERGQKIKFKHTTNSLNRIGEAREALNVSFARAAVDEAAADFMAEVAQLTNTTVTDAQWAAFQDELLGGVPKDTGRSRTLAMNKRAELEQLYRYDERSSRWTGTAFGVLQAVNTFAHHGAIVRGMSRPLRNADRAITGGVDKLDAETMAALDRVLATA